MYNINFSEETFNIAPIERNDEEYLAVISRLLLNRKKSLPFDLNGKICCTKILKGKEYTYCTIKGYSSLKNGEIVERCIQITDLGLSLKATKIAPSFTDFEAEDVRATTFSDEQEKEFLEEYHTELYYYPSEIIYLA